MSSVQQNVIKHKVGLLNLAAELGNVSRACKVMGFSRDTFYRYQAARDEGGVDALIKPITLQARDTFPSSAAKFSKPTLCLMTFC